MKTLTWFFVFLISLTAMIPKADISQLSLLGNLYSHFEEYHSSDGQDSETMTFLDFIAEHYSEIEHEHQDEEEHEELPFKEFTSSGFYVVSQEAQVNPICIYYDQEYVLINAQIYPRGYSSSIDHPPSV